MSHKKFFIFFQKYEFIYIDVSVCANDSEDPPVRLYRKVPR